MSKFKVGDRVGWTEHVAEGTVTEVGTHRILVGWDSGCHRAYPIDRATFHRFSNGGWGYDKELELVEPTMSKFKVGDRVGWTEVAQGTVTEVDVNRTAVMWDDGSYLDYYKAEASFQVIKPAPEYEDEWHLNDGKVDIPEDADTLEKDGSVVAFRKVKKPKELTLYVKVNGEHWILSRAKYGHDTHKVTITEDMLVPLNTENENE